ncbi:cytidine and deoxycytidylate deaminase zinc-binding region domain-containing protein [Ditylenchus destructor]|nr:cytidine and deoxycytidylate deaminase zinc-binding region domain-containing protein [Ditylenchus destructor]
MATQNGPSGEPNSKFMLEAVGEACHGVEKNDGGPFGAVVVKNGEILARGHNMVTSTNDPTAHAEVTAIRNACKILNNYDLSGCTLYSSCYPCPMCMGACLWAKLDAVYYAATSLDAASVGFDDQNFHDFVKDPHAEKYKLLKRLEVTDYMRPFNNWNTSPTKRLY